jgi:hypothetical protein
MPVAGVFFESATKGYSGTGNVSGTLVDFLDEAGKLRATPRRLFLRAGCL